MVCQVFLCSFYTETELQHSLFSWENDHSKMFTSKLDTEFIYSSKSRVLPKKKESFFPLMILRHGNGSCNKGIFHS